MQVTLNRQYKGHLISIRPISFGINGRSSVSIDGKPQGIATSRIAELFACEVIDEWQDHEAHEAYIAANQGRL